MVFKQFGATAFGALGAVLFGFSTAFAAGTDIIPKTNKDEAVLPSTSIIAENPKITEGSGSFLSSAFAKRHRDLEEAKKYILEILKHDPNNQDFLQDAIHVATLTGDIVAAQAYAERLPEEAQTTPLIASLLALKALDEQQEAQAKTYLAAVKARGLFAMVQPVMLEWLSLKENNAPITMDEAVEKAGFFEPFLHYHLALMNDVAGHNDTAVQFYKLAEESQEVSPYRVVQALINFYSRQGRWNDVAALIAKYKEENPNAALVPKSPSPTQPLPTPLMKDSREGLAEVYFTTASLLYSDRPALEVFWYLRLALHLRPDFAPAQFMLASLYEQISANERAIITYDEIKSDSVFYTRAQIRKALNLEVLGEKEAALTLLEKVANANPDNITALTTRGDMLRTAKKFAPAVEAYSDALKRVGELSESDWPVLYARGICHERNDQWALAEADFKHALALSPDQPDVLNYLAYSWLIMNKNVIEARDMLRVAVEARPEDAHIIDSVGWAYYLTGDYTRAVEYLEKAVTLAPLDMAIIDHLGDAYWRQGRAIEAQYQWQRVVQYANKDEEGETLKQAAEKKLNDGLTPFLPEQLRK